MIVTWQAMRKLPRRELPTNARNVLRLSLWVLYYLTISQTARGLHLKHWRPGDRSQINSNYNASEARKSLSDSWFLIDVARVGLGNTDLSRRRAFAPAAS
jgi:hypothetical protein